jgi:Cu(I)/Ag(I) efflux system membrane protein CusA/SilA
MIEKIIEYSIRNRLVIFIFLAVSVIAGIYAIFNIPIDAIPDLSDVQVIIQTEFPGQGPEIVEDQVTYPLTTAMLSVPNAKTVRGYSFFGISFVYIIFEDGTDLYDARARVLEYLNFVSSRLPQGVTPMLGPDATGVGWIYQYALVDTSGRYDLSDLRSLQDWFLKYELMVLPGVSEVASVGGYVRQYQVEVDPNKLAAFGIPLSKVKHAVMSSNKDVGGRLLEMGETEFMVRGLGYIESLDDLRKIAIGVTDEGAPILLDQVSNIHFGPELRRGLAELDGEGETVGGIVVIRFGENTLEVIDAVKTRIEELKSSGSIPEGVVIKPVYDRSKLISSAISNLRQKLIEEMVVVALICIIFLLHFRSGGGVNMYHLPFAFPFRFRGHIYIARRRPDFLFHHALHGNQRQYHVAGRNRHRHRGHGGRFGCDGGERP